MCEISSTVTIKTTERRQWLLSGVLIVNFEHIFEITFSGGIEMEHGAKMG